MTSFPSATQTQVWFNRSNKRENDQSLYDILLSNLPANETHLGIVLPGDNWFWEEQLINKNLARDWRFYGCNNNPDKAQRVNMVRKADELNTQFARKGCKSRLYSPYGVSSMKLSRMLGDRMPGVKYSLIYADFWGSWCMENNQSLQTMFWRKMFKDESFLIITSQIKSPRQKEENFDILRIASSQPESFDHPAFGYAGVSTPEFKIATKGIESLVHANAAHGGYIADLVHFNLYNGDRKGHKMLSFCYKINKK